MVYPVSCTAVCYVTVIALIKKVGVVRPNFLGSGPPDLPSGCAHGLAEGRRLSQPRHYSKSVQPVPKAVSHLAARGEI